jgi:protein-disulfide isomerase
MTDTPGSATPRRLPPLKTVLDVGATLVLTVAAVLVIRTHLVGAKPASAGGRVIPIPSDPLDMDGSAAKGATSARVGIVAFSDFQCPFCGRFARDIFPELDRDYIQTGKLRFVFRHLPLRIHDAAFYAATAAECAAREGKFWDLHDRLFATDPRQMSADGVNGLAVAAGVDPARLAACAVGGAQESVKRDADLAQRLGIASTPVFLLGSMLPDGRLQVSAAIPGARPLADFRARLDALLQPPSLGARFKSFFGVSQ